MVSSALAAVLVERGVVETNLDPKPFVWTADPKRVPLSTAEANVRV
jgi:hypothetical protein